jgi:hypothetical protein
LQIKSHGSHVRGDVKDIVRAKIAATYGFVLSDNHSAQSEEGQDVAQGQCFPIQGIILVFLGGTPPHLINPGSRDA